MMTIQLPPPFSKLSIDDKGKANFQFYGNKRGKPYKPYTSPRDKGRGRGRGRPQWQKKLASPTIIINQDKERKFRRFERGRRRPNYDKSPTKKRSTRPGRTPNKDNDRCNWCQEIGHSERDCQQKMKDVAQLRKDRDRERNKKGGRPYANFQHSQID